MGNSLEILITKINVFNERKSYELCKIHDLSQTSTIKKKQIKKQ